MGLTESGITESCIMESGITDSGIMELGITDSCITESGIMGKTGIRFSGRIWNHV